MSIEIKVPGLPESVSDATVAKWYKRVGETISRDENLVDLETDKVMLAVPAPQSGVVAKIIVQEGNVVTAGQLLAVIEEGAAVSAVTTVSKEPISVATVEASIAPLSPSVRRLAGETGVDVSQIPGSGKGGRVTVSDVQNHAQQSSLSKSESSQVTVVEERLEKRVPMSRLRQRVAERLVQVQQEAAILTTFNEIDMQAVSELRKKYKEEFETRHGARLGFMSFFTKAVVEALKQFPAVNASIDRQDIIYHNYYDIGIAIGSERGLVVPIIRNADQISMANIENQIRSYAAKAKEGKIAMEELTGGTFTITNAGTYGSLMSTPIINPPQSAILGMHNIIERPVAVNGQIVIRPMMYVALSYDHRIIDGREAVSFLMAIKKCIEDPARMILQLM